MNDTTISPMKRCSSGDNCVHPDGPWQPLDLEHFGHYEKTGWWSCCRLCAARRAKEYRDRNPDKRAEQATRYRELHRDKINETARLRRKQDPQRHKETDKRYYQRHLEEKRGMNRRYYAENREKELQRARDYRAKNPDKARESGRRYRATHPDRLKRFYDNNPGLSRIYTHRRLARKRRLPDTLTTGQWQRALDYFNGCCAVCGRQLRDLFATHTAAADHWIPLASPECPGTVAENVLPLCHGENGCNNLKSSKPPRQWLIERFGKRRAADILARVEIYFDWVQQQDKTTG